MNDLIPSVSIENMLSQRQGMIDRFRQIQTIAGEMKALEKGLGGDNRILWYDQQKEDIIPYYGDDSPEKREKIVAEFTKKLDGYAWRRLMKDSGNLTFMDAKAREDWSKSIQEGKHPELTYENIVATFRDLHASRQDMFHRSIISLFQKLSWDYKTNRPFKFGKRIIISYITGYHSGGGKDKLDDLTRAHCVLDGKPEPDYRQGFNSLIQYGQSTGHVENDYLSVKWFKNANGHVTFKRPDLIEKMNKILHLYYPNAIASEVRDAA